MFYCGHYVSGNGDTQGKINKTLCMGEFREEPKPPKGQFPYLQNRNDSIYLIWLLKGLNNMTYSRKAENNPAQERKSHEGPHHFRGVRWAVTEAVN